MVRIIYLALLVEICCIKLSGVLGGIQTPDLQDRNLLLYSAELRAHLRDCDFTDKSIKIYLKFMEVCIESRAFMVNFKESG